MRLPCILKLPKPAKPGHVNDAMISWADITPTLLDFAGATPRPRPAEPVRRGSAIATAPALQGRSFLSVVEQDAPSGWDEIFASHTFHEITMYYPMRVVRTRTHKLIWNIANPLPVPFASDLHDSKTWQGARQRNLTSLGRRPVKDYLRRPRFELYDLKKDHAEINNLADNPEHAELLAELQSKLKQFQHDTDDPWLLKWDYE